MTTPDFPNGFELWLKTHFEIVEVLCYMRDLEEGERLNSFNEMVARSATDDLHSLAVTFTNKYEEQTNGSKKEQSLFDEIGEFVWSELRDGGYIRYNYISNRMRKQLGTMKERLVRYNLGTLLVLLALNAFAGGYYGMAGAESIPVEWLEGSPFRNYFIPSLVLFFCVGGSALMAAFYVFRQHRYASRAAFTCGLITLIWLASQVAIIGYVSWMQPTTAIAAFIILFLTFQLPDKH